MHLKTIINANVLRHIPIPNLYNKKSIQCTLAAVISDKSPYYKRKYESLIKHYGKKRTIVPIAHFILTAIRLILSTGKQWNPGDLKKIDMPVTPVKKQKKKNNQVIKL